MKLEVFRNYIKSIPQNGSVLEIGCGMGDILRKILEIRSDLKIYCIDIQDVKNFLPAGVSFVIADAEEKLPFEENTFDGVVCLHVLEHLQKPQKTAEEVFRILKKGGSVLAETPHWITTFKPFGFNFYDDHTHVRPHTVGSLSGIFSKFSNITSKRVVSIHSAFSKKGFLRSAVYIRAEK